MAKKAVKKAKKAPVKGASNIDPGRYEVTRIRGRDGKIIYSRGAQDAVAKALLLHRARGGEMQTVIDRNHLSDKLKQGGHSKKPPGQLRLIVGTMLRGMVRAGTPVRIGNVLVEKLTQKVELPKVEKAGTARPARVAVKPKPVARKAEVNQPTAKKPRKAPKPTVLNEDVGVEDDTADLDDAEQQDFDDAEEAA